MAKLTPEEAATLLIKIFKRKADDIVAKHEDWGAMKVDLMALSGTLITYIAKIDDTGHVSGGSGSVGMIDCLDEHSNCTNPPEDPNYCDNKLWDCLGRGRS